MKAMRRFWMSWACDSDDHRPLTYPPNDAIRGWWCSGYDADGNAILCAVVDATSESEAAKAVHCDWPESLEYVRNYDWRFIEPRDGTWKPGDRFPASDWMIDRLSTLLSCG